MWDNFRLWYISNQDAISWFIIGYLVSSGMTNLACGLYGSAILDFIIAGINYKLSSFRMYE